MAKKTVEDIDLKGKKVLVRADFNVPVSDGAITDDTRIKAALPTIKYVTQHGGKAILLSHLGRVKTEEDKEGKSLAPVAKRLGELLDRDVTFVPETRGEDLKKAIADMQDGEIVVLENTRFEDVEGKKESKNDPELGKYWASLADVFVNDAFGTAHRSHASNVGIASTGIPTVAGFLMEKEIKFIGEAVDDPKRPMIAILGGAKVSDKIGVIENLIEKADKILIGGGMTYTFYKAKGEDIGNSMVEEDKVELAKSLIEKAGDKLVLPVDSVTAKEFSNDVATETHEGPIPEGQMGLDIGPKTVEAFSDILKDAKTVVWNGPMGVFEMSNFAKGTIGICEAIANLQDANTIIGGGDSAAAAESLGFADKFTHISTGGGASLELLEGKTLPGLAAINDK